MDPQSSPLPTPPVIPSPHHATPIVTFLTVITLFLALSTAFLGYQDMQLQKQITSLSATAIPTISPQPTITGSDSTIHLKTFINQTYGFEVKTPFQLELPETQRINGSVTYAGKTYSTDQIANWPLPFQVIKGWVNPSIYAYNANLPPIQKTIAGVKWYAFYDDKGGVPGCDFASFQTLTPDKKNIISVDYLDEKHCPGDPEQMPSVTFLNQILSTFKFVETPQTDDILQIIQNLTKPMAWSIPKQSSLFDSKAVEVFGVLITTNVPDKTDNKFAPLLTTNSPLVVTYGWQEVPEESGSGKDGEILTYKKQVGNSIQKLIIRSGIFEGSLKYIILLTNSH